VRTRVPDGLLRELGGETVAGEQREACVMWRSRWFDMFLVGDRVEAMHVIWGVVGWLMRLVEEPGEGVKPEGKMEE